MNEINVRNIDADQCVLVHPYDVGIICWYKAIRYQHFEEPMPLDEEFAKRFTFACNDSSDVPKANFGRLGWVAKMLADKYSITVTQESVRRWLGGISIPRKKTLLALADLLAVNEAWLALGVDPELSDRQRQVRNACADGVVNVVAGFIQMNGGHPAFPLDDSHDSVDLTAVIKGAQYSFHVALAVRRNDEWRISVPVSAQKCLVIGVVPVSDTTCRFFDLDWETMAEVGSRTSSKFSITLDPDSDEFYEIKTFSKRL